LSAFDQRLHTLLAAAARTFADRGFHATSMRDLSRASGMSLAGIYHYVASKEELLYLIQDRCFAQVIAGARTAIAGEPDAESRLLAFIRHHVVFFAGHMDEMKVLSHEADELRGTMRAQLRRRKREYVALLLGLLEQIQGADIAPQTASYALFGMMNWIYTWYHPTGPVSPEALGDDMGRLFLNGFARPVTAASTPLVAHHGG
jgi:AcrR family transcriptional regulator